MPELLGVATGFFFALTSVGGKLASKGGATASQTTLMTLVVSTPFFALLLLVPGQMPTAAVIWNWQAIFYFVAAGLLSSIVARIMYFSAVDLVGPSRLNQLVATDSLFALAVAAVLVGERVTWVAMAGIGLITLGVFMISSERNGSGRAADRQAQLKGVAFGLGCAALYAFRNTFIRMGLDLAPSPAWGAAVGNTVSLAVYLVYLQFGTGLRSALPRGRAAVKWTFVVGLAYCGAWLTMFYALQGTQVALLTALKNTAPFFSMALAWLLIGKEERLNLRILASGATIVAGVLLVM